jgi:hypothetical protein
MDLNDTTSKVNGPLVHFTPYSLSHTFQIIHVLAFFRNVAFTIHLDIYTMSRYTVHAMHVEKTKGMEEVYINNNICNPQCPLQFALSRHVLWWIYKN